MDHKLQNKLWCGILELQHMGRGFCTFCCEIYILVHNLLYMINCFLEHLCVVGKFLAVSSSGIVLYYIHESYSPDKFHNAAGNGT
jgi:hypothetical protein